METVGQSERISDPAAVMPLLTRLTEIAPTYFVTGNHEWVREDTEDVLKTIAAQGVTVLRNDFVTFEKEGQTLVLAGAEDPNGYRLEAGELGKEYPLADDCTFWILQDHRSPYCRVAQETLWDWAQTTGWDVLFRFYLENGEVVAIIEQFRP